jgi:hypothetical protein
MTRRITGMKIQGLDIKNAEAGGFPKNERGCPFLVDAPAFIRIFIEPHLSCDDEGVNKRFIFKD